MKKRFTIRVLLILTAAIAAVIASYVVGYRRERVAEQSIGQHVLESDCFEMHGDFLLGANCSRSSILPKPLIGLAKALRIDTFNRVDQVFINNNVDAGVFEYISQFPYLKELEVKRICPDAFQGFCDAASEYRASNPNVRFIVGHQVFDPASTRKPQPAGLKMENSMRLR